MAESKSSERSEDTTGNRAALIAVVVFVSAIAVALLARRSMHRSSLEDHAPSAPPGSGESQVH